MRIIFDDIISEELKSYLLTQDGIENINLTVKDFISEINIDFNNRITPKIITNYIYLFENNEIPTMLEFDKGRKEKCKSLKYTLDDMCCEYCYKSLIQDLFDNEFVISVKSNFDFNKPCLNIKLLIEYNDNYDENKLIKYIKEKIDV